MYFIVPFVKMIKEVLYENMYQLYIPNKIIDSSLLKDGKIKNDLKKFFDDNQIIVYENSNGWYGNLRNIQKARDLLETNPPEISYIGYPLFDQCNILSINNQFNKLYKREEYSYYVNKATKTLFLPANIPFKNMFNIKNDDITMFEKNKNESRYAINMFNQDGTLIQSYYDVDQVYNAFLVILNRMYDAKSDYFNINEIFENQQDIIDLPLSIKNQTGFPMNNTNLIIPFGQLVWAFINEPKISNQTRTYIASKAIYYLKISPKTGNMLSLNSYLLPINNINIFNTNTSTHRFEKNLGNVHNSHRPLYMQNASHASHSGKSNRRVQKSHPNPLGGLFL